MKLRHEQELLPFSGQLNRVSAICWSPNMRRLAAVTVSDRVVHLFDEQGERKDKFLTKPANKGPKTYIVTGMTFSPDSQLLAIAQSDNIVFIYKLGLEWGDRKSICNKFAQTSSVTCITWPRERPDEVVFGTADGKVKVGLLSQAKTRTLYPRNPGPYTVALASGPDGHSIASAHIDGSVFTFSFEKGRAPQRAAMHPSPISALAWGAGLCVAGNDGRVLFYNDDGRGGAQPFDYNGDARISDLREFSVASANVTGDSIVVGNWNKFFVFSRDVRTGRWEESQIVEVENLYAVSSLAWRADGSKVSVGNMCGVVDVYDAHVKRTRMKGFDLTFVSPSQVVAKHAKDGHRITLRSDQGHEIVKVSVHKDRFGSSRFIVAFTASTLLIADAHRDMMSEIPWHQPPGKEPGEGMKFVFDSEHVAMVYSGGELTLVEYGKSDILHTCRTEHLNAHLVSVRINERPPRLTPDEEMMIFGPHGPPPGPRRAGRGGIPENKKIAYLQDAQSISVFDLVSGVSIAPVSHDARIDWLELNARADLLLFRDKRRHMHLFNVATQQRQTLLTFCTYVQWVPESDVVVAQNRESLCVWYNIHSPDDRATYDVRGDVEEIVQEGGATEVIVRDAGAESRYRLDETLIGFSAAVDDHDYDRAVTVLDSRGNAKGEAGAMWRTLYGLAVQEGELDVAERCAAALGDVAKARFLHKINKTAAAAASTVGGDGRDFWQVKAQLAQLRGDLKAAEMVFIDQGQMDEAIKMYQTLQRWDDAIRVAESTGHPEADRMKGTYLDWLLETHQEEEAAALKERDRDYPAALNLYLSAQMPARAARLIDKSPASFGTETIERVAAALAAAGLHQRAGELYERLNDSRRALDSFLRGKAFRHAVELARREFPEQVVVLEEAWGDHLVALRQYDGAIRHFAEAGNAGKAIQASIDSQQWTRAVQLVDETVKDPSAARPYYLLAAQHYASKEDYGRAEKLFVKAGQPSEGVQMYTSAGRWNDAQRLAKEHMTQSDLSMLYIGQAERMAADGRFKEAETLYVMADEPDLAIAMLRRARKYDRMISIVRSHRPDLLEDTLHRLAMDHEKEGKLREAERFYTEGGKWQNAVNMYRMGKQWEEAVRVARTHGGEKEASGELVEWAMSLGAEEGARMLADRGLIDQAIEFAISNSDFKRALQLAESSAKHRLPRVHLKFALSLEDMGKFKEAEREFVAAAKPREAIEMFVHEGYFEDAMRVAEAHDPGSITDVHMAQGNAAKAKSDVVSAERHYVNAKRPEAAIEMYQTLAKWDDALRVAKRHAPHRMQDVARARQAAGRGGAGDGGAGAGGGGPHGGASGADGAGGFTGPDFGGGMSLQELLKTADTWAEAGNHSSAVDTLLRVTKAVVQDPDELEKAWLRAVAVADKHVRQRHASVAEEVAGRLMDLKRFKQAGQLYRDVEEFERAVDCFVRARAWDEAREIASDYAPALVARVQAAYREDLVERQDADELVADGAIDQGIELYMQRGQWTEAVAKAEAAGTETAATVALRYVHHALSSGGKDDVLRGALEAFGKHGAPAGEVDVASMRRLVTRATSYPVSMAFGDGDKERVAQLRGLRQGIYLVLRKVKRSGRVDDRRADLERLLMVAHFVWLRAHCRAHNLTKVAGALSASLLRYCDVVPADKALFEAGHDARGLGQMSMAYVVLNVFLDLEEAMEEQDVSSLDNSYFVDTDVPAPPQYQIPDAPLVPREKRENARETVLSWAMTNDIDQTLPTRTCDNCNSSCYEGSLSCRTCRADAPMCIASGMPIPRVFEVTCPQCRSQAHRAYWNEYVKRMQSCPWCGQKVQPYGL